MKHETSPSPASTGSEYREALAAFGARYDYDVRYLYDLLEHSPAAFGAYLGAQPMSETRAALPLDAHFVARIATMQVEDCGACAQLNIRMALEAGLEQELLHTLVFAPDELPENLRDVRALAGAICRGETPSAERIQRLREHYGHEGVAEISVAIAGSRIFPSLKKALGYANACERLSVDV